MQENEDLKKVWTYKMASFNDHKTLNCPLCFKTYTTPRILPCSHTFCENCLGECIESQEQDGSKFACPLCEAETIPCDSKLAIDKWASTFPLNTLVFSLLESSLDLNDDVECEPCKAGGENKMAEFWCTICQEKLCSSCNGLHRRNKLFRNHTIVPIDEIAQHQQSNINFDQECGRHRSKTIELFCVDHKELCCAVCGATDHRQCQDVRSIEDIARDQSQRSKCDYHNVIRDIRKLETEMEKIISEKKSNAKQILLEKDQILQDMDNRIDRIINHLNKLRNTFREETDQLYEDTEKSILKNGKTLQSFMINLSNSRQILDVVEITGILQHKFTTFKNIGSQIASHYDQLQSKLKDDVEVHFSMKPDIHLDDIEGSLKSLGSVEVTLSSSVKSRDALLNANKLMINMNSSTKISTEMCAAQVEKVEDLMTSPVTFVKATKRDELGSSTWFNGGTCLGDGRLVMCDCNNNRLVELNDEYNVVKMYNIDGTPTDVAAGNKDNEIYIAVNQSYIFKCTLDTDLKIVSRIKAPSGIRGIAVSGDNIIVGTGDALVILTQNGSTLRSIPKSGYDSYVALSQTQRTMYHKDNQDVVCRTWEGKKLFRYRHQQLKYPCGMCTDKNNNLYICGRNSHNVHQVSHDGQRSSVIQLHNIIQPNSIVFHPQKNQIIVTSRNEDTVCEIYKLVL